MYAHGIPSKLRGCKIDFNSQEDITMVIHNAGMDNQATIDLMVSNGRKALAELAKLSQESD